MEKLLTFLKLKVIVGMSLIAFFVFMTTLFTSGIVAYARNKDKRADLAKIQEANNKLSDASAANDPALAGALTAEEVAKHGAKSNCWIIVDGNVYDVTAFLPKHPGGPETITPYCGGEATADFNSRDKNPPENHSSFARNLLRTYYIGPFGRLPENLLGPDPNGGNQLSANPLGTVPTPGAIKLLAVTPVPNAPGSSNSTVTAVIDATEVSKHNTLQNCWMIISGKVYDITNFATSHPGGTGVLASNCGKDATTAFKTKGGGGSDHSSYAYSLLANYLISNLGSTVVVSSGSSNSGVSTPTPAGSTSNPVVTTAPGVTHVSTPTPTQAVAQQNLTLTTSEIATHNTLQNCWLIISGKVYDVTKFISQHPGGVSTITNMCGKESTTAFQTKGGRGGNHSSYAYSLLNNYLIGTVGASVAVNATSSPTPVPTSSGGGGTAGTATPVPTVAGGSCPTNIPQSICSLYSGQTVVRISGSYEDDGRWEGKVSVNGSCRAIKTNSSGAITTNNSC